MKYANLVIPFAGGLGMFIYGMQIMAQGLEHAAGTRMKSLLEALTRNKLAGVLLGAVITAVIQSSSATTVMVVGFVNAEIMNLTQAMSVIMGANIGTTATGWLVSAGEWANVLKPETLAPVAIMGGVIILLVGKRHSVKEVAGIVIGFGLLFVGISTMSDAVKPLRESESFRNIFVTLGGNPLLGVLAGAVVTAVIQSSSASVGILQSLASAGLVPFQAAIYIIMGQNIGTCVTAMLSGIGAKKNAKTAAFMHLLFNIIGTLFFGVLAMLMFAVVRPVWVQGFISQTQISFVHTIFNIATTLLLFPFSGLIIRLAKQLSGIVEEKPTEIAVSLDERMLETPPLALQATISEVHRVCKLAKENLELASQVLFSKSKEDIERVRDNEKQVDLLCAGITEYAIRISSLQISEKEHETIARLLQIVSDAERVSDHCENISESAEVMLKKNLSFSDIGEREIKSMIDVCIASYRYAVEAMVEENHEKALQAIGCETKADALEVELRTKHIRRLAEGKCHAETGIIFVDILVGMERISDHARNIAEGIYSSIT